MTLTLHTHTTDRTARLHVVGDLDYLTADEFVTAAEGVLAAHPDLRDLHLDCADLNYCDSAGVSGLLRVHRQLVTAGIRLHLDHRPAHFERILDITGLLSYLIEPAVPGQAAAEPEETELG